MFARVVQMRVNAGQEFGIGESTTSAAVGKGMAPHRCGRLPLVSTVVRTTESASQFIVAVVSGGEVSRKAGCSKWDVRLDERGWETGRRLDVCARAQPRLYRFGTSANGGYNGKKMRMGTLLQQPAEEY